MEEATESSEDEYAKSSRKLRQDHEEIMRVNISFLPRDFSVITCVKFQECFFAFEEFYVNLMSEKIFDENYDVGGYLASMTLSRPNDTLENR